MRGTWRKVGNSAVPVSPEAVKFLEKIGEGRTFSDGRSRKQEGLFHLLCSIVAENLDTTEEEIRHRVIHKAGYVETWIDAYGRKHEQPKSIRDMRGDEFHRCVKDCIPILAMWISVAPKEVIDRFNEIVDPKNRLGRDGGLPERRGG